MSHSIVPSPFKSFIPGLLVTAALGGSGCTSTQGIFFPAENADQVVMHQACETSLGRGIDACRFMEGSGIEAVWQVHLPPGARHEVRIRFKDRVTQVTSKESTLRLPWKEIVGSDIWFREHDGPVQLLSTTYSRGGEKTLGLATAHLIILKPGYNPVPVNAPVQAEKLCRLKFVFDSTRIECE